MSKREVYLEAGYAYVPVDRLVSIIVARFRTQLSRALLVAFNSFPYVLADARYIPNRTYGYGPTPPIPHASCSPTVTPSN